MKEGLITGGWWRELRIEGWWREGLITGERGSEQKDGRGRGSEQGWWNESF